MREETKVFFEEIKDELFQDYTEYIESNVGLPLVTADRANFIDNEIYHGKYVFFIGRLGNHWILETESGHRFTIKYFQQKDVEPPYNQRVEYFPLEEEYGVHQFYQKYYKVDENTIKFNLDNFPPETKEYAIHHGETLHLYQPIRITHPVIDSKEALIAMPGTDDAVVMYMFNFEIVSEEELNQDKEFLCSISEKYLAFREIIATEILPDEELHNFLVENNVSEDEFEIFQKLIFKESEAILREQEYLSKVAEEN